MIAAPIMAMLAPADRARLADGSIAAPPADRSTLPEFRFRRRVDTWPDAVGYVAGTIRWATVERYATGLLVRLARDTPDRATSSGGHLTALDVAWRA